MTNEQAKQIFNEVIAKETNPDRVANLELCREYFTNPDFRNKLEQHVWDINQQKH